MKSLYNTAHSYTVKVPPGGCQTTLSSITGMYSSTKPLSPGLHTNIVLVGTNETTHIIHRQCVPGTLQRLQG